MKRTSIEQRKVLLLSLLCLMIASMFLLIGPRIPLSQQKQQCVVDLHIAGPFGVSLNCDSPEFIKDAVDPSNLLKKNSVRQSRPGLIFAAYLVSKPLFFLNNIAHYLHPNVTRHDIAQARINTLWQAGFAVYAAYLLLNIVILFSACYVYFKLVAMQNRMSAAALSLSLLFLVNPITQTYLWSPHTQMFNIMGPLFLCFVLYRGLLYPVGKSWCYAIPTALIDAKSIDKGDKSELGVPGGERCLPRVASADSLRAPPSKPEYRSPKYRILKGEWYITAVMSLLVTAYGTFLLYAPLLFIIFVYQYLKLNHAQRSVVFYAVRLAAHAIIFSLPMLIWYLIVKHYAGSYYVHEAVVYRQFVWMRDAWHQGAMVLLAQLGWNAVRVVELIVEQGYGLLLAIVGLAWFLKTQSFNAWDRQKITAMAVTALMCALFVVFNGFVIARMASTVIPIMIVACGYLLECLLPFADKKGQGDVITAVCVVLVLVHSAWQLA